jgi:hypothetical protein
VDPKERWQTLQAHLTLARQCLEDGDSRRALEAIEAALAIDPEFLAAHALRDRIRATPPSSAIPVTSPPIAIAPAAPSPAEPIVSTERYATFVQRTRRRRVDRQLDAARAAIAAGRVRDAESALDEVRELDPNVPDLPGLIEQLDALRLGRSSPHRGRWIAAAAAFLLVVAGASWLQESRGARVLVAARPATHAPDRTLEPQLTTEVAITPAATTGATRTPSTVSVPDQRAEPSPAPTSSLLSFAPVVHAATEPVRTDLARPTVSPDAPRADAARIDPRLDAVRSDARTTEIREPIVRVAEVLPAAAPRNDPSVAAVPIGDALPPTPVAAPSAPPLAPAPATAPIAPPSTAASAVPASIVPPANDELLVKQALQRYRKAYEGLDAPSAHAVWPAVNEAALARAFDGLQSQTLTFDACEVNVSGAAAAATCRGSARYIRKVGSHDPLVEPRTWNFTLKKDGTDWKIESARANR